MQGGCTGDAWEIREHALHVAVRTERLLDVTLAAELGGELDRLEPADVLGVEEHPADDHLSWGDVGRCREV